MRPRIDRSKVVNPAPTYPYYVRLQRFGDLISLDYSPDNTVYQSIESVQSLVGLAANVEIGFAVTSRTTSLMSTTFDKHLAHAAHRSHAAGDFMVRQHLRRRRKLDHLSRPGARHRPRR